MKNLGKISSLFMSSLAADMSIKQRYFDEVWMPYLIWRVHGSSDMLVGKPRDSTKQEIDLIIRSLSEMTSYIKVKGFDLE